MIYFFIFFQPVHAKDFVNAHENFQDPECDGEPVGVINTPPEPKGSNVTNDTLTGSDDV